MEIVYHGGMHKTGTTLVQMWLEHNQEQLRCTGTIVLTPQTLVGFFKKDDDRLLSNIRRLISEARTAGMTRIIISHEKLSLANSSLLGILSQPEHGVRTHFVLAIRHWNSFLLSRWKQNVKRADTQSFKAMMSQLRQTGSTNKSLRLDLMLERIIDAKFNKLSVLSYETSTRDQGILSALLGAFDVAAPNATSSMALWIHRSPDIISCDISRIFNGVRAWREGRIANPVHAAFESDTPFAHLFDHNTDTVVSILDRVLPDLRQLMSYVEPILLRTVEFDEMANRVERLAAPYLLNPVSGMLFDKIEDHEISASPVEMDHFSTFERNFIWSAVSESVNFARTGTSKSRPFPISHT